MNKRLSVVFMQAHFFEKRKNLKRSFDLPNQYHFKFSVIKAYCVLAEFKHTCGGECIGYGAEIEIILQHISVVFHTDMLGLQRFHRRDKLQPEAVEHIRAVAQHIL